VPTCEYYAFKKLSCGDGMSWSRPDYLKLGHLRGMTGPASWVALTATASEKVIDFHNFLFTRDHFLYDDQH
jgi:superfamily II DNA helicase RecQ